MSAVQPRRMPVDRRAAMPWRARPWRRAAVWLAVLAPFFYLSYGLANHLAAARAAVPSVVFDWERHLPFWAWTVFPYWSLNAFYGLSLFLARHRRELDRHAARLLTAQCVAVACFIAFPLRYSFGQPAADGAAGLLFEALRSFDQPYNQAPSLHVALVVILWDLYRRRLHGRVARGLLHGGSLAIVGSVLTTYQHHAIDVPTGALLGVVCVWAWPLEPRLAMAAAWRRSALPRCRQLARRYALGALGLLAGAGAGAAMAVAGAAVGPERPAAIGAVLALGLLWAALALAVVALNYAGLGVRGFQIDAHGRMAWAARVLLAPYTLAARLNAWAWTRGQPAVHEIAPGVAVGSLARLDASRAGTVLSLSAELPLPPARRGDPRSTDATRRCLPALDLVPVRPATLRAAAAQIEAARRQGGAVLVVCALGYARSVAAVACWLLQHGHARSPAEALRWIRRLHPQARLDAEALHDLQQALAAPAMPRPGGAR